MAYCRFSSMNWKCDVYCYEAEEGIVINLAGNRIVGDVPSLPEVTSPEFMAAYRQQMDYLKDSEREPITLPDAGKDFYGLSHEDAANELERLRAIGYVFPDDVISVLREEAAGVA